MAASPLCITVLYFNSRTSCEVRLIEVALKNVRLNFNSRTSCEVRPVPNRDCCK